MTCLGDRQRAGQVRSGEMKDREVKIEVRRANYGRRGEESTREERRGGT
jgi:hypothetical protein